VDELPASPAAPDEQAKPRPEGILFLAREPLNTRRLAKYASLADGTAARTLIRQINRHYDARGRAVRVEEIGGGMQLLSRPAYAPWLRRLGYLPPESYLSAPSMETLAVVAYRQPVLRVEVEAVRGVACGEILRQLMDRDLVRIAGRSDELGRPYLYGTTRQFLRQFGLRSLEELPRVEAFSQGDPSEQDPFITNVAQEEEEKKLTGSTARTTAELAATDDDEFEFDDDDSDDDDSDDDDSDDDDSDDDDFDDEDPDDEELDGEWVEVDDDGDDPEDDDDDDDWDDD